MFVPLRAACGSPRATASQGCDADSGPGRSDIGETAVLRRGTMEITQILELATAHHLAGEFGHAREL